MKVLSPASPKPDHVHCSRFWKSLAKFRAQTIMGILLSLSPTAHTAEFYVDGFSTDTIATGLTLPTAIAFHSDRKIFIAQKNGVVRIIENGELLEAPFLELDDVNSYGDRGLIGITIDPDFGSNGFVYLAYTHENDSSNHAGPKTARVVRYTANGNTAVDGSETILLGSTGGSPSAPACENHPADADCIASDSITHTVGGIRFGRDGKLYVAVGDGADFTGIDLNAFRAQDLDSLSGKILRIESDGRAVADNPFHTGNPDDNRSKVWAYGFRNPYRFNFHPFDNRLLSGDVGWSLREEINHVLPGLNYGWPCREGTQPAGGGYPELGECQVTSGYTDPIHDYVHVDRQGAVTGGAFATSESYPSWLQGSYVFADFSFGTMYSLTLNEESRITGVEDLATDVAGPVEIVTGPDGLIYYLSIYRGTLIKIIYSPDPVTAAPVAKATYLTSSATPLTVEFDASESGNSSEPLDYQWQFGDGSTGTGVSPTHNYAVAGTYQVTLTVTSQTGLSDMTGIEVVLYDRSTSNGQPFVRSLVNLTTPGFVGSPVTFRAMLGNDTDGDPFSVLFEIVDSENRVVGAVWLHSLNIPAGVIIPHTFSWLSTGPGNYHVNVSFYRDNTRQLIRPIAESVSEFEVVARSQAPGSVRVGTIQLQEIPALLLILLLVTGVSRSEQRPKL